MRLQKWKTISGVAVGNHERLTVTDAMGFTYHWWSRLGDVVHVYRGGQLVESIFVKDSTQITRELVLSEIELAIQRRNSTNVSRV